MLEEIPIEEQYVFTSMRYDGNGMKPGITRRSSTINGKINNPVCTNCPDASTSAYLMKYHYDRLLCAAEHLGWYDTVKKFKGPVDLFNRVEKAVLEHKKKTGNKCPFKVRLCLRHNGKLEISVEPVLSMKPPLLFPETFDLSKQTHSAASKKPIFKAVLDVLPTRSSTYTREKTYYRTMYNYARHCAGIQSYQDAKEVLLYNKESFIMDGSITTPYFYRDGKWITPHTECGGQQGTTRRWAIDHGLCTAGHVPRDSLRRGEIIWLSNGVKGFFTARVLISSDISRPASVDSRTSFDSSSTGTSSQSSVGLHATVATAAAAAPQGENDNGAAEAKSPAEPLHLEDDEPEDDIEVRRKHPPVEGSEDFRKSAFSLDVFERTLKL